MSLQAVACSRQRAATAPVLTRPSESLRLNVPVAVPSSNAETGRPSAGYWPSSLSFALPAATAEYVSVALGGLLFALIGIAMAWSVIFIVIAALGFALCTWLAGSLARGLICVIASIGLLAALLALASKFIPGIFSSVGVDWGVVFVIWWAVALAGSGAFRRSGVESGFGLAEIAGCGMSIVIAAFLAVKLDFHSDLLPFLLHAEDNAAWVSLTTQAAADPSLGANFAGALGPVMPLLLGLLHGAQQSDVPAQTATFAAYALAVVFTPLIASSLLRGLKDRPPLVILAFAAIVFAWAYHLPALLYAQFGHLSATWAFLSVLLITSFVMFDRFSVWALPIGIGLVAFLGGAWFPIAPLAACLAAALCIPLAKSSGRGPRIAIGAFFVLALIFILIQPEALGISLGSGLSGLSGVKGLYLAGGGTAELDPLLLLITLAGVVALASVVATRDKSLQGLSALLIGFLVYIAAIYALSDLLQIEIGYGVKKLTFVLGFAVLTALIASLARFPLDRRTTIAVLVALSVGVLVYGGGNDLLGRKWPGDETYPSWLAGVQKVIASQPASGARPIACVGADQLVAYACTRWAGALTPAGDSTFFGYRSEILIGGTEANRLVNELGSTGVLASGDIIVLNPPAKNVPWSYTMVREGGRVFGPTGTLLKTR